MVTLKEILHTVSLGGIVASMGVLAGSVLTNNAVLASFSTLSGTVSLYAYVGCERSNDRKRLKADLDTIAATLNQAETELKSVQQDKSLLESQLQALQGELSTLQSQLQQMVAIRHERDVLLDVQVKYERLQEDYKRLDQEQTQDNIELETLRFQCQELQIQSQQVKSDLDRVTAENSSLSHENLEYRARFNSADELAKLRAGKEVSELQDKIAALQQTYNQKMTEYVALAEKHNELIAVHDSALTDLKGKFAYLSGEGFKEVEEGFNAELSERDQILIAAYKKISELEAPHYFDDIGDFVRPNRLIKAMWESEQPLCLDGSEIVPYPDSTGFDVYFSLRDRKVRGQATIDALNNRGNEFSVLCSCIKDVKFSYDRINPHRIKATFILRKATTQGKEAEIMKLWEPASKFPKLVKKWARVRITGGSETGKSPTVENMVVCILEARPGKVFLHNPQHNSVKNYWSLPTASTSHDESFEALKELADEIEQRSQGKSRSQHQLHVFDEMDSTMTEHQTSSKYVKEIVKQASHQNVSVIICGQNANAKTYQGMDRSDFNNVVNVHLGSNIFDALENTNMSKDWVDELKPKATKLLEFCEAKNAELGLDASDPKAYRVALIVEPNKKPYFIELPEFGCYEYDSKTAVSLRKEHPVSVAETVAEPLTSAEVENAENSVSVSNGSVVGTVPESYDRAGGTTLACPVDHDHKLSEQRDGRYYCSGCKAKYAKAKLKWI
ncbi:MAG: hypothetical protein MUC48_05000 [Leptolyngbya sp. Prado105]|jgi:ADP-ribose pyrophosphatase YjhB (NUDIX family)|nr:hypothetical protein [Leptolyngbya sp. Prado105]